MGSNSRDESSKLNAPGDNSTSIQVVNKPRFSITLMLFGSAKEQSTTLPSTTLPSTTAWQRVLFMLLFRITGGLLVSLLGGLLAAVLTGRFLAQSLWPPGFITRAVFFVTVAVLFSVTVGAYHIIGRSSIRREVAAELEACHRRAHEVAVSMVVAGRSRDEVGALTEGVEKPLYRLWQSYDHKAAPLKLVRQVRDSLWELKTDINNNNGAGTGAKVRELAAKVATLEAQLVRGGDKFEG